MQTIYFCSTNIGKKKKLESDFGKYGINAILEIIDFEVDEIQNTDNIEVSKDKARKVYDKIGKPSLSMDSGLYISELNNFPGSYVKHTLETIGVNGILKLMETKDNREFVINNCLAYNDGSEIKVFYEEVKGTLTTYVSETINNDFAWSELYKILIPHGFTKTLAEMNNEEYLNRDNTRQKGGCTEQFAMWHNN